MTPQDFSLLSSLTETFKPESAILTMAKKNASKHTEDKTLNGAAVQAFEDEAFDDAGTEEEQIGFPPYWSPASGRRLKIRVTAFDQRDPTFPRWVVQATHDVACQSGPSDEAEPRLVKKGEFFSMSLYAALPLQKYVGEEVIVECKDNRDIGSGKTLWVWSLRCTPEVKARVAQRNEERQRLLTEQNIGSPMLLLGDDLYAQSQAAKKRVEDGIKAAKSGNSLA
jgi:hypothetical protein